MTDNYLLYDPAAFGAVEIKEDTRDAEITRLRDEIARLREALKPFGEALKDNYYHQIDAFPIVAGSNQIDIRFKWTLGELRAAAAAIREGEKDDI